MTPALRVLTTPAWILRTVVALLAVVVCLVASAWQYQRTSGELAVARAAQSLPVAYQDVVTGDRESLATEWLGRSVVVAGVVGERSLIRSRLSQGGQPGYLVVDQVRLDDGRAVAVLQGWVPRPAEAPALAGDRIQVTGRLQPPENFYADAPVAATGPLLTITDRGLAGQWGDAPAPGYVTVVGEPAAPGFGPVRPVVGADPDVPFPLQNAFYSLQWLIFAGVVIFIWARFFRDDVRQERGESRVSL